MARPPSHYALLGLIERNFTPAQLKRQYRALALRWHPDRNRGNEEAATAKFKQLQEAFEVLSDPDQRRAYDESRQLTPRQPRAEDPGVRAQREAREKRDREARDAALRSDEWLKQVRRREAARAAQEAGEELWLSDSEDGEWEDEAEEIAAALRAVEEAERREAAEEAAEEEALRAAIEASSLDAPNHASPAAESRRGRLAEELARTARALVDLAREPEPEDAQSANFDAAIPALIGLLRIDGPASADAAWALSTLVSSSSAPNMASHNRDAIRASGGIEPLAALLSSQNSKAAEAAGAALWSLAKYNESTLDAVMLAVIVAAPPSLERFPYLLATLRSAAAQRLQHTEALTRGARAEAKECARTRLERAASVRCAGSVQALPLSRSSHAPWMYLRIRCVRSAK